MTNEKYVLAEESGGKKCLFSIGGLEKQHVLINYKIESVATFTQQYQHD